MLFARNFSLLLVAAMASLTLVHAQPGAQPDDDGSVTLHYPPCDNNESNIGVVVTQLKSCDLKKAEAAEKESPARFICFESKCTARNCIVGGGNEIEQAQAWIMDSKVCAPWESADFVTRTFRTDDFNPFPQPVEPEPATPTD
ncbi:hypothetical protein BGX33_008118 [Mortierella sp. NVP41]|nr:hypothetical protein BGX33_008118 [Mortierella sp. NVP41]